MTEGHPSFVANNGRIGFGVDEHAAYAPESGAAIRPLWLGVRKAASHLALGVGLDEDVFYLGELGAATIDHSSRCCVTRARTSLVPATSRVAGGSTGWR